MRSSSARRAGERDGLASLAPGDARADGGRFDLADDAAPIELVSKMEGAVSMHEHEQWRELGQQLRVDSVRAAAAAGSGHPTSSMSAADLMAVLLAKDLRY